MTNPRTATEPLSRKRWRLLVARVRGNRIPVAFGVGAIELLVVGASVQDRVLYNHSPSMPVGIYVRTASAIERGAIVTVNAVDVAGDYARLRDFADESDRFIKRVAASVGDTVCAEDNTIRVNGVAVARRMSEDSAGRTLPSWSGCRVLAEDEMLLLGDTQDSFDGRYWGVVSASEIEGVWRPWLVTRSENLR